jgi:hypothetical protein
MNDCPDSYAWQFADLTSTFHCINADYSIQFCPENAQTSTSNIVTSALVQTTPQAAPGNDFSSITTDSPSTQIQSESIDSPETAESTDDNTDAPARPLEEDPIGQQQSPDQVVVNGAQAPKLNTSAIIGIAIGGVGVVLIMVTVIAVGFVLRRRRAIRGLAETSQQAI